ncbi:hypothetical protein RvY_06996, partial [Ramazzottius varieornatus]
LKTLKKLMKNIRNVYCNTSQNSCTSQPLFSLRRLRINNWHTQIRQHITSFRTLK